MILRSRILLPISAPPVEDGAVLILGDRIRFAGAWGDLRPHASGPVTDLGEAVLLPGLINAHCHLDYTHLAGQLAPPASFPDWIKAILAAKAAWGFSEYAGSWLDGARQLLASGTTTVANIESVPELLDVCPLQTPLRVCSFLELTGVRSRRAPAEILAEAERLLVGITPGRGRVGLSPHSPYSTTPDLLRAAAATAQKHGWRLSSHVAESQAEFDMFMYRRGPMFEWLEHQRPADDCGRGSPVQHLDRCGLLGPTQLAAHVNYLWHDDARLLARRDTSVVHCPQSHAYFRHHCFPRPELSEAGVNLCLGTDSLASTRLRPGVPPTLSLFDEMRALATADSMMTPHQLLEMATINGARALGQQGRLGQLTPGAMADVIAVPFTGKLAEATAAVVHHQGPVPAVMINGDWERLPPQTGPGTARRAVPAR
ncbi:MAG TPA: amidohydrolase family protein [Candidatus Limnocylindria bacterium]|nr:amidohydrolase family protein [Candidatus Limnocylindria bacterium]